MKNVSGDDKMTKSIYPVLGDEVSLPFYLTGIGTTDPEYHVVRTEGLVSHQILFTTGGKGVLKCEGKEYPQTAGTLTFLPPALPHEYYPEKDDWQTSWVVFRGNVLPEIMRGMGFDGHMIVQTVNTAALSHIFSALFSLAGDYTNAEKCSELLYELVLETKRLFESRDCSSDDHVSKAVSFMESEFRHDLSLSDIAAAAGLSEQHFCRVFRKATGMTPIGFLTRKRISEAKALLSDTDMPVSEVGKAVGFADKSYFTYVFRKFEGYSPSEYKKAK